MFGQRTRRAQQAAVATHHDHQIAGIAETLPRRGLHAMARQHLSDVFFENHVQMALHEESLQPANGIQHLGTAQAADDADIAELIH